MQMNLQLHHVVSDITGATGMRIIRAVVAGERDPATLAALRDQRCKESAETIRQALVGNDREEHVFALAQALELYDAYLIKVADCDKRIEAVLTELDVHMPASGSTAPQAASSDATAQCSELSGPVRHCTVSSAWTSRRSMVLVPIWPSSLSESAVPTFRLGRVPSTSRHGSAWRRATRSPAVRCSRPEHGGPAIGASALLRLAAVTVGRTETALGAFYRRLAGRVGKAKAVTATARKLAVLFYNTLRHGMGYVDPGASYYEDRYRQRVLTNLQRRAKSLGYVLQSADPPPASVGVS